MRKSISLTSKMLLLTISIGIAAWALIDYFQADGTRKIFEKQLLEKLTIESTENRANFDLHIEQHANAVKIITSMERFTSYVAEQSKTDWHSRPEGTDHIKYHSELPEWLPKSSIIRSLVRFRYAILLDNRGVTREVYSLTPEQLHQSLIQPTALMLLLSHERNLMTTINDVPQIISSHTMYDSERMKIATLVITSPLDSEFLNKSQGNFHTNNIVALTLGDTPRIFASNKPDLLLPGTPLESLKDSYLITGKSFFDYGSSDLQIEFLSLISTHELEQLSSTLLAKERWNRFMTAIILICSFSLIMLWITKRVQGLTRQVEEFSKKTLQIQQDKETSGDAIHILEENFIEMTNKLKISHESLKKAKEEAEMANKAKSQFLSNMSHELRTPINGVMGFSQLLQDTSLDKTQREYLETIDSSANHLLDLTNDILDLSMIESKGIILEAINFDLPQLTKDVLKLIRLQIDESKVSFIYYESENMPVRFIGDPKRIKQILINLLGNAIKFTHQGEIRLTLSDEGPAGSYQKKELHTIKISVKDTGIGIAMDKQKTIFDEFSQEDNSDTRQYGGVGLGLSITKRIVDSMSGQINVFSDKDKGSEFVVTFPIQLAEVQKEVPRMAALNNTEKTTENENKQSIRCTKNKASSLHGLKVLLVEDDAINGAYMLILLKKLGCEASIVRNGQKAIEKITENRFDIVLMDIQMPVMNGLEATEKIRSDGNKDVIIIALTAAAMKGDRERIMKSGMDDYITKPVMDHAVKEVLCKWAVARSASD